MNIETQRSGKEREREREKKRKERKKEKRKKRNEMNRSEILMRKRNEKHQQKTAIKRSVERQFDMNHIICSIQFNICQLTCRHRRCRLSLIEPKSIFINFNYSTNDQIEDKERSSGKFLQLIDAVTSLTHTHWWMEMNQSNSFSVRFVPLKYISS